MKPKADFILNTQGLLCPEPIMMLHAQLRKMQIGETVEVLASDPATQRDIPQLCEFLPHELLEQFERLPEVQGDQVQDDQVQDDQVQDDQVQGREAAPIYHYLIVKRET